ncbi:MAG: GIY-YIG nuclease family protein [bacterium]
MDKQHILKEIKRTAKENGGVPLGTGRFYTETGIRTTDWEGKHWTKWGDALIEAGYEPNTMQGAYEEEFVIEKMISLVRELGVYPVNRQLKLKRNQDEEFPSLSVFGRIGNKSIIAKKTIEYCEGKDGFDDVVEICKPIAEHSKQKPIASEEQPAIGYVYLMKSGRYYKIGKSNAPGRREYDIGLKLPEETKTIHTIKTDDPEGIEEYWHKRFKDKRKKGEWFDLSGDDIKAFKRRKFM